MKTLQMTVENNIATVMLNRPDSKNAMSFDMMRELVACAKQIRQNRQIRAVILTGGSDTFCSGLDLNDLKTAPKRFVLWELLKPKYSLFQAAALVWRDLPIPVIAAIEGHCLGAGVQLALAADFRMVHPKSQWAIMEAKWGIVPDMGLTQTAAGIVRMDILRELTYNARIFSGKEASDYGMVTDLTETPLLAAQQLAEKLVHRSPDGIAAGKKLLNEMIVSPKKALRREKTWQLKLLMGKNQHRAVKKAQDSSVEFHPRKID